MRLYWQHAYEDYSPFCLCAGHKSSGSVKLQLEFSAHSNPSMLTVKLVDIVLMSSKAMSLGKHFCNFMCQCVYNAKLWQLLDVA